MSDRPRGGRRPEDFPEAMARDDRILKYLRDAAHHWTTRESVTRNLIWVDLGIDPRLVSYSLERLRDRGLVEHIPKGNEGHGYWAAIRNEDGDA